MGLKGSERRKGSKRRKKRRRWALTAAKGSEESWDRDKQTKGLDSPQGPPNDGPRVIRSINSSMATDPSRLPLHLCCTLLLLLS